MAETNMGRATPGLREQVDALMATRLTVMPELEGPLAEVCPGGGPVTMTLATALGSESMELSLDRDLCCLVERDTMGELPGLLARPALVGRAPGADDELVVVLPALDGFILPLMAVLGPAPCGGLEVTRFMEREVAEEHRVGDFYDWFGLGVRAADVLYIGSEAEDEIRRWPVTNRSPEPFWRLARLPRDRALGQWRPGDRGGE